MVPGVVSRRPTIYYAPSATDAWSQAMSYSTQSTVPIEMLPGIGQRTAKILRQLGVATIGQFRRTPEQMLVELFGPSIRKVYAQVTPAKQGQRSVSVRRSAKGEKTSWLQKVKLAQSFVAML